MLSILLYGEESIAKYRSKIFTIYFYLFILLDCYILRNDIIRTISLIFLMEESIFYFYFSTFPYFYPYLFCIFLSIMCEEGELF